MNPRAFVCLCALILLVAAPVAAEKVAVTIVHLNDIYEIQPLKNGTVGGMARVASLVRQLRKDPSSGTVITVLAGDAFSPSALGTALVDPAEDSTSPRSKRFAGAHMVDVMNTAVEGKPLIEYAVFGNHEFDLSADDFRARMTESLTNWFSSNVRDQTGGNPIHLKAADEYVIRIPVPGESGKTVSLALIGSTIDSNRKDEIDAEGKLRRGWVQYVGNPADATIGSARTHRRWGGIGPQRDILIAVTHLELSQDRAVAEAAPEIDLILGGHEHERAYVEPAKAKNSAEFCKGKFDPNYPMKIPIQCLRNGAPYWSASALDHGVADTRMGPPIFKADANAKSAWVHKLSYDTESHVLTVESMLHELDRGVALDETVAAVVKKWVDAAAQNFEKQKPPFQINARVTDVASPLDGRETCVRGGGQCLSSALVEMVADAVRCGVPGKQVHAVLYNGGMIRIDDLLGDGATEQNKQPVSQLDVIRVLPFGGEIYTVEVKGARLANVLDIAKQKCIGQGCYLQTYGVSGSASAGWTVAGFAGNSMTKPFQDSWFTVALPQFLVSGREQQNIGKLLNPAEDPQWNPKTSPMVRNPAGTNLDVRQLLIKRMQGACKTL